MIESAAGDEKTTVFRRLRETFMEEAAQIVEAAVIPDAESPDPIDISYNMALLHAAEAIRRAAKS